MKLFYSKGACSLSTHIIIHELGINCEFEAVDLAKKVTETGVDFYTINKKGAVPTLQLDNGELITENLVIQQYLVDTHKDSAWLCPAVGTIRRYHVLEWLSFATSDLHKSFTPFFNSKVTDEVTLDIFRTALAAKLTLLEKQLSHQEYIAGDEFTLPDAYIFVVLRWLGKAKLVLADWPNLSAYMERIKSRPAVIKAMTEEGLLIK